MRADSMPYGRIVTVCAVDDVACSGPVAVGLPCSSGNTGSHRRSGGRRWAVCTRRTPHISPTTCRPLCDDSPEPYPLPDRRLTRERRCPIIRAESCDHLVTSTGTLVLAIRRAREECRIRSAVHRGTESWVCAARRRAPNGHGHWSGYTRASRLRSVSTRRATPTGTSAFED